MDQNSRPACRRNRPISPIGRRGQPPGAPAAFSRDAVGIVIFEEVSPCCAPRPALSHCHGRIRGRTQRSKRHGFSFHGDAAHARLPPRFWSCAGASGALAEEAAAPASQPQPAATPSPSPSGQKGGAGRGRCRNTACRRRAAPPAAGFHHDADAGAARPHARLHRHRRLDPRCSTKRASRRPISPTPPISSTASIAPTGR